MKFPWQKSPPVAPPKIQVIGVEAVKLQLSDWQKDPALVTMAQKVFSDTNLKIMLQVIRNEHPAFQVLPKNFPNELRSAHQSQCEGYTMCLANLEAMATLKQLTEMPEPDYSREEPPTE